MRGERFSCTDYLISRAAVHMGSEMSGQFYMIQDTGRSRVLFFFLFSFFLLVGDTINFSL